MRAGDKIRPNEAYLNWFTRDRTVRDAVAAAHGIVIEVEERNTRPSINALVHVAWDARSPSGFQLPRTIDISWVEKVPEPPKAASKPLRGKDLEWAADEYAAGDPKYRPVDVDGERADEVSGSGSDKEK